MSKKIGLLLTRSVIYPTMSFDLMGGMKAALAAAGLTDIEIKTESISIGADDKLIYAACEKMLFDGAELVAGYINPTSAEKLQPLFEGANAVMLALDAGMHFPTNTAKRKHIYSLSLQGALCVRSVVTKAVHAGNGRIANASSFYDAGYRASFACARALEDAGGGVTFNLVTPLKRSEFSLEGLSTHLGNAPDDAVFASFCGDMLQDFFATAGSGHILDGRAVYGSPFVADEQWLAKSQYPGVDVQVCVPWATTLETDRNRQFIAALKEKKVNVGLFSLLGWEAGTVAAAALGMDDAATGLEGFSFGSPRGEVLFDAGTHMTIAPVYEAVVVKEEQNGNCTLAVKGEYPATDAQWAALLKDIAFIAGNGTSWFNAYGCLDS